MESPNKIRRKNFDDMDNDEKGKSSIIRIKKKNVWSNSNSFSPPEKSVKVKPKNDRELISFQSYVDEEDQDLFQEEENLPERIEGEYIYDYNILQIDEIIKKRFQQNKKKHLSFLYDKLDLEKQKILERQTLIERKTSRKKIEKYEKEIRDYEEETEILEYISKSTDLLSKYRSIGSISKVVSFMSNNKEEQTVFQEDEETQEKRHEIIFEYLEIARKYIQIDLIRKHSNMGKCIGCGIKYEEMELIEDDSGAIVCPNCGLEKIVIYKTPLFSDNSRVNNARNNYEDRANFEKVLMRYQGKQPNKPEKELYEKLEEYFSKKGLLSSEEYRKLPLLANGKKEGSSRELMFEALNAIGCSGYYDDINLICHVFFDWVLPDVTHLEEDIMRDYDISQRVYEQLPDREGRKSSLNSQWRLYVLLRRRGWKCKSRDFKIPMTQKILEYHKIVWKQICEILDWECIF